MHLNGADNRSNFTRHSRGYPRKSGREKVKYLKVHLVVSIKQQILKSSMGSPPVLCEDDGQVLVKRICDCSRKVFPQKKLGVHPSVKQFVTLNQRKRNFKNNMPGNRRFPAFPRRYPMLSTCISGNAASFSATMGEPDIKNW
jgi:hypothetical protein